MKRASDAMGSDEASAFLGGLMNYERSHQPQAMRQVRLERMRRLCERLGNPQQRFRSVLVAGTNAKGSIAAMIASILRAAGTRVGLYLSPHLEDVRERIRIPTVAGGAVDWISPEAFAEVIARLRPAVEARSTDSDDGPLTYFEVMTAAAFTYFAQRRVEIAVLEVGLGGRLDATNVVEPVVSVLGPIGFDHTDVLGEELLEIAREKAGIMRPGGLLITASQQPSVAQLLRDLAGSHGSRLVEYGQQITARVASHTLEGLALEIRGLHGRYDELHLPLLGRHQADNAALAVAAVESLAGSGAPRTAVRQGLRALRWPGRLEVVSSRPTVLFDGGHNAEAARALRRAIEELWPGQATHLLIGMSADKPIESVAKLLGPIAASVTCTSSAHPRACPPDELARHFRAAYRPVQTIADPFDACTWVLNAVAPTDLILITGSLFLIGRLRSAFPVERKRRVGPRKSGHHTEVSACPSSP